jgi:hypothetical protein
VVDQLMQFRAAAGLFELGTAIKDLADWGARASSRRADPTGACPRSVGSLRNKKDDTYANCVPKVFTWVKRTVQ